MLNYRRDEIERAAEVIDMPNRLDSYCTYPSKEVQLNYIGIQTRALLADWLELDAANERLKARLDRRNGDRLDCESCGGPVPFAGAVFCSLKCSYAPGGQPFAKRADPGPEVT